MPTSFSGLAPLPARARPLSLITCAVLLATPGAAALAQGQQADQHDGPEAKHHLDLAEQVEQARMARKTVGKALELLGAEGVEQGCGKDSCRHRFNRERKHAGVMKPRGGPTCAIP